MKKKNPTEQTVYPVIFLENGQEKIGSVKLPKVLYCLTYLSLGEDSTLQISCSLVKVAKKNERYPVLNLYVDDRIPKEELNARAGEMWNLVVSQNNLDLEPKFIFPDNF